MPLDGMERTIMNDCNGHEGLLLIIGELLYKNQLLREAITAKEEALVLIHLYSWVLEAHEIISKFDAPRVREHLAAAAEASIVTLLELE
jgi:hypothetical protein